MRLRWLAVLGSLLTWTIGTRSADAGVLFFVNDPAGFDAAIASLALIGSEDWSSAGSAAQAVVTDPLQPGVAKSPFPNGVAASTGMTVQSNTLGSAGATVAPGGNLFYAPAGSLGVSGAPAPSNQLSSFSNNHGFDMIFGGAGVELPRAVSFSPMFYRTNGPSNSGTIAVKAFGAAGGQLGTTSVTNVVDVSEASFLGVVATASDAIGRVNLWAGSTAVAGADNIDVFDVPEAGGALAALAAVAALSLLARR